MSGVDVETILKEVEELLARAGELPPEAEQAVRRLLNVVEALSAEKQGLAKEVERLRQQIEKKKKPKTTREAKPDDGQETQNESNHSSEKRRRQRRRKTHRAQDRRSFKELKVHETIECAIDPDTLPPDTVRLSDESVVVQDIEIKPHNIRFQRHVYYWAAEGRVFVRAVPIAADSASHCRSGIPRWLPLPGVGAASLEGRSRGETAGQNDASQRGCQPPHNPEALQAFVNAQRWTRLNRLRETEGIKDEPLLDIWNSAIQVHLYQLDSVIRALSMPRVTLLLADGVGLGKTIEAGLVHC